MFDNEEKVEIKLTAPDPSCYGNIKVDDSPDYWVFLGENAGINYKYLSAMFIAALMLRKYAKQNNGPGNQEPNKSNLRTLMLDMTEFTNRVYTTPPAETDTEKLQNRVRENSLFVTLRTMIDNNFASQNEDFTKTLKEKYGIVPSEFAKFIKQSDNDYDSSEIIHGAIEELSSLYPEDQVVTELLAILERCKNDRERDAAIFTYINHIYGLLTSVESSVKNTVGKNNFVVKSTRFTELSHNGETFIFNGSEPQKQKITCATSVETNGIKFNLNEMQKVTEYKTYSPDNPLAPITHALPAEKQPIFKMANTARGRVRFYLNTATGMVTETPDKDIESVNEGDQIVVYYGGKAYGKENKAMAKFDPISKTLLVSFKESKDNFIISSLTSGSIYETHLKDKSMETYDILTYTATLGKLIDRLKKREKNSKNNDIILEEEDIKTLKELGLIHLYDKLLRDNLINNLYKVKEIGNFNPINSPFNIPEYIRNSIDKENITDEKAKEIINSCPNLKEWASTPDMDSDEEAAKSVRIQYAKSIVEFAQAHYEEFVKNCDYTIYKSSQQQFVQNTKFKQIYDNIKEDNVENILVNGNQDNKTIGFIQKEIHNGKNRSSFNHWHDAARNILQKQANKKTGSQEDNEELLKQLNKNSMQNLRNRAKEEEEEKEKIKTRFEDELSSIMDIFKVQIQKEGPFARFFRYFFSIKTDNYKLYDATTKRFGQLLRNRPNNVEQSKIDEALDAFYKASADVGTLKSMMNIVPNLSLGNVITKRTKQF